MKRDLIPFLEFLKIADDPGTETRRHLLDQYFPWNTVNKLLYIF